MMTSSRARNSKRARRALRRQRRRQWGARMDLAADCYGVGGRGRRSEVDSGRHRLRARPPQRTRAALSGGRRAVPRSNGGEETFARPPHAQRGQAELSLRNLADDSESPSQAHRRPCGTAPSPLQPPLPSTIGSCCATQGRSTLAVRSPPSPLRPAVARQPTLPLSHFKHNQQSDSFANERDIAKTILSLNTHQNAILAKPKPRRQCYRDKSSEALSASRCAKQHWRRPSSTELAAGHDFRQPVQRLISMLRTPPDLRANTSQPGDSRLTASRRAQRGGGEAVGRFVRRLARPVRSATSAWSTVVYGGHTTIAARYEQPQMQTGSASPISGSASDVALKSIWLGKRHFSMANQASCSSAIDEMDEIKASSRYHQWHWSESRKSHECIVNEDKLSICFHPQCSESSAACRAAEPLKRNGNYYYWEIFVQDKIYGTSVMFGLCTDKQQLHTNDYCNLVGLDSSGWSLSHKGLAWHNGLGVQYTSAFPQNTPITIGLLFNTMRGELSYFMNGKNLGVAFTGLNDIQDELYPVVASTAKCTQMRLLGSYCSYVSLLERSCFTLLKGLPDRYQLIEYLRKQNLPKHLIEYVAHEANIENSYSFKRGRESLSQAYKNNNNIIATSGCQSDLLISIQQ